MALIRVDSPADSVRQCRYGHPLVPDNLSWDVSGRDGVRRGRCRTCKRASVQKSRGAIGRTDAPSMLMPRMRRGHPVIVSEYETRELFRLIPKDLRDGIARAILDPATNDLVRRVIRRCIARRAWAGMHEDAAARVFIEMCIEETLDARSPMLRPDRLLRVVLCG